MISSCDRRNLIEDIGAVFAPRAFYINPLIQLLSTIRHRKHDLVTRYKSYIGCNHTMTILVQKIFYISTRVSQDMGIY